MGNGEFEWKVWRRSRCIQRFHYKLMEHYFIKDMRKAERLGKDLEQMLIVDDIPLKVSRNYGNAVCVRSGEAKRTIWSWCLRGHVFANLHLCKIDEKSRNADGATR